MRIKVLCWFIEQNPEIYTYRRCPWLQSLELLVHISGEPEICEQVTSTTHDVAVKVEAHHRGYVGISLFLLFQYLFNDKTRLTQADASPQPPCQVGHNLCLPDRI